MRQSWCDLLFAHWRLPVERLRPLVPAALELDTFDRAAWLAVAPFTVRHLRLRGLPEIPGVHTFPELNVRTYVTVDGKPGIYFFSLDAASASAALGARLSYLLPYFPARMSSTADDGGSIDYESQRVGDRGRGVRFLARYRAAGEAFEARPGSLEHFLVERYCLYSCDRQGRVYRGEIHHEPWRLQVAEAQIEANSMTRPLSIELAEPPALLHFVRQQDTFIWLIRRAR